MFSTIKSFLLRLFTDFQTTFIWLFAIGILVSALLVWTGGEENAPKFKKSLVVCIVGMMIFLLAKPLVQYMDAGL
jgi:uncharacterized YccA/Bax inhibitor family protein